MGGINQNELLERCMRGETAAQKELYDLYSNDMFKVCLMYGKDYDTACDLLQEGFLKVFQNIHKFREAKSLGGWIRTVIVRNCIDFYRSDRWHKYRSEFNESNGQLEDTSTTMSLSDGQDDLYQRDDFLRIIKGLPDGYSMILNLYFLEGYTHKEIAEHLNITVGTSKSQLFKAKRYLKKLLQETLSEEELKQYEGLGKKVV